MCSPRRTFRISQYDAKLFSHVHSFSKPVFVDMKYACLRLGWVVDFVGFEFLSSILVHLLLDAQCFGKIVIFPDFAFLADWAQDPLFVVVLVVQLVAHSQWHLFVGRLLALVVLLLAHPQWLHVVTPPEMSPASILSLPAHIVHIWL